MALSEKDVLHAAKLAALKLEPEELAAYQKNLNTLLEYVDRLSALQTRGVAPTSHVHGVVNAFRDDIIRDSLPVADIERSAPEFKNGSFRVPKII